jgi:hypothetical protein
LFLIGCDAAAGYQQNVDFGHIAANIFVISVATSGTVLLWHQLRQIQSHLARAPY